MKRFNEWLAVRGTSTFGTMWAFYAFAAFGLLPLLFPDARDQLLYWSNVLQLVALPLLMVGQMVQGRTADQRAIETHDAVMAELAELKEMHAELRTQPGGAA